MRHAGPIGGALPARSSTDRSGGERGRKLALTQSFRKGVDGRPAHLDLKNWMLM
jgi:hypothetical protein